MKKVLITCLLILNIHVVAYAELITIGTATYSSASSTNINTSLSTTENVYKLIWDNDNNGNSVVWLDYTEQATNWENQMTWADSLNGSLLYNINPTYKIDWGTNLWRLPFTADGYYVFGYDGTTTGGYNIITSEMGHLYYSELGNIGLYDKNGTLHTGYIPLISGEFENLDDTIYWSSTIYSSITRGAWKFPMDSGRQSYRDRVDGLFGLAIRTGTVIHRSPVPEPATIFLLGLGIIGLSGVGRRG